MQAIQYTQYGSPDVLQLHDISKPTPKSGEVLVKIHASSANPLDWHLMRGEPFLARLEAGLQTPQHPFLGADLAGTIEAVADDVTEFKVGDAVFGEMFNKGLGAFAEYVCIPTTAIVHKPENLTFEEAAAVPLAGQTALQGLRDRGQIKAGQHVLINGASGGVGTFAIQIAKALGAEVTGVCSTRNLDMVTSLGAGDVIDYTKDDFTRQSKKYDLVFDLVGNHPVASLKRALKPDGICAVGGFTSLPLVFGHMLGGPILSMFSKQDIGMMSTVSTSKDDLLFLSELLSAGKLKPVIDRCYPLEQTADAIRYLETMRARGKVIISIA